LPSVIEFNGYFGGQLSSNADILRQLARNCVALAKLVKFLNSNCVLFICASTNKCRGANIVIR